jgi:hypothetical protein
MFMPPAFYQSEVFVRLAIMQTGRTGVLKFKSTYNNEVFCTLTIPTGSNVDIVLTGGQPGALTELGRVTVQQGANVWYLIQAHFVIAPSGGGSIDFRLNGVQLGTYTGTTASAAAQYKSVLYDTATGSGDGAVRVDDYAVNDVNGSVNNSWVLDGDILGAPVTGQGAYAEWTGSDGNQVNNYDMIDGVGTSLSDYVESNTVNQRELYTITPDAAVNLSQREIVAVQPLFIARKTNANDPAALRPIYRDNGTDYELDPTQNLDINWQYLRGMIMPLAPDQAPWTASKLSNLQVGVKKTS